jgi:2,4-dienoyl-CoA reductase (NADPH2)
LGLNIPISDNLEVLKEPVTIKDIFVPNRLAIQPMEGFDAKSDGSPSELTIQRYQTYAKSGVGIIWFEASAISEDCRSNPHQLVMTERTLPTLKKLVDEVRYLTTKSLKKYGFAGQCFLIMQLNHSGRYCRIEGKRYPKRAFHYEILDKAIGITEAEGVILTDSEIEEAQELFIKKALLVKQAGFDGVDIKSCHGYLIGELLASRTRTDSIFGGESLDNRARLLVNIFKGIYKNLRKTDTFQVTTRLGVHDGISYPYGFGVAPLMESSSDRIDLSEPLTIIMRLYEIGLSMINITAGNPHFTPHITRPYDVPIKGGSPPLEHPLTSLNRIFTMTGRLKAQFPSNLVTIGSAYSYFRQFAGWIGAGMIQQHKTDIVGFGRMAIANPKFPKQLFFEGKISRKKSCIACSRCSELMKHMKNTGCAIRNPYYMKVYQQD